MKRIFLSLFLALVYMACSAAAWGQQPSTSAEGSAQIVVTVEPKHGSNAPVIHKEDVMVYEGRDRDQVVDWIPLQGDRAGLQLFILIDDGSGVSVGSQLDDIRQFINSQPPSTKIGIAYMQNGIARVAQDLTNDHAAVGKALRLPIGAAGANASPYFSLTDLLKKWPKSDGRRAVLMVSDGIDRCLVRFRRWNDFQQPHIARRIEEVCSKPRPAELIRKTLRNFRDRKPAGIGGYDGPGFPDGPDFPEQTPFDFQILDDGFNNPIHFGEFLEVVFEVAHGHEPRQRRLHKRGGLGFPRGIESGGGDLITRGRVRVRRNNIQQITRYTGIGKMRGDAGAHGSGAKNGNFADALHNAASR